MYKKAANLNVPEAQVALGTYYDWGVKGLLLDGFKAAYWYKRASENGSELGGKWYNLLKSRNFLSTKEWTEKKKREKDEAYYKNKAEQEQRAYEKRFRRACGKILVGQRVTYEERTKFWNVRKDFTYEVISISRDSNQVLIEEIHGGNRKTTTCTSAYFNP